MKVTYIGTSVKLQKDPLIKKKSLISSQLIRLLV